MEINATLRHILLCVTGLTPQVITETLYALYKGGHALPEQIHILTTQEGAERARLTLINDHWLSRFYEDYGLPQITFDGSYIHILQDHDGNPLQDIRSDEDNRATADGITEMIRILTAAPDIALHVSIAGGRKTMGFYAGYALSLYGRQQDRLSHVLVAADYESHPQFYYPTPYSQVIYGNDPSRKPLDTQHADVILADITFVRLRHGLDQALLQGKSSFSESVKNAQQSLAPPNLIIDLPQRRIVAQGRQIRLTPADLAFYLWLIERQQAAKPDPPCPNDGVPDAAYALEYLHHYKAVNGELGGADRTIVSLQQGMSKSFFEQRKSRINKALLQFLNQAAQPYLIVPIGSRPRTRYRVALQANQIQYQQEING
ncbi:MAG: CRISPR-associated ring nuclease Csm6 [Methylobacter sp.]